MRAMIAVLFLASTALVLPACETGSPLAPPRLTNLSFTWSEGGNTLAVGETLQLRLVGTHPDGGTVTITSASMLTSDDESIATVSSTGLVTAVGVGDVVIRAKYLAAEFGLTVFVR